MAFRGRGRGGRTGGIARHDITLKDDEDVPFVPSTFPAARMPPKASPDAALEPETQRLLNRFQKMRASFRASPFYQALPEVEDKLEGTRPDLERYLERASSGNNAGNRKTTQALHQVVMLHEKYLPSELYSAKDQRASLKKRTAEFFKGRGPKDEIDLDKLREMAQEDGGEEGDKDKKSNDDSDKEGERELEEDDDELDHEDDDYYQGENYDDDEEYGAEADDGEGEAYY